MEETLSSSMQINSNRSKCRLKPPENLIQSLQIEKYRLDFLHKCKYRKRPPQSLRLAGCNGLPNQQKITLISKVESDILFQAISNKIQVIKNLENAVENDTRNNVLASLTRIQCKQWIQHFRKKLAFF